MEKLHHFIKTYEIWIFLLFAPISSAVFVFGINLHLIPGRLYIYGRFFLLLFLLMAMVKLTRGNSGLKDLFKPMLVWKVPLRWYLFSFFFAASIACLTLYLKSLYFDTDFFNFTLNFPVFASFQFTFTLILFALVGEVVWVSYAVRRLSKIMNPFFASQIVGVVWALWWAPIVLFNVGVIGNIPIIALIINMMGAAGMCAIIYAQTKSGLCVWILQVMLNSSCLLFPVTASADVPTYWIFCFVYFLVMLGFMYYFSANKNHQKII
jgi:membrane protease YdiL (CAAX protease family)